MIKVMLFALVLIFCWPIALVVGAFWLLFVLVSLACRLIMMLVKA